MRSNIAFLVLCLLTSAGFGQEERQTTQYARMFTLPGVTFSEDQTAKISELKKKYIPQLEKNQARFRNLYTQEQRQARKEAIEQARKDGKQGQELQTLVENAVKLTKDQQQELKDIQTKRTELLATIQAELRALLTKEQQTQVRQRGNRTTNRGPANKPTHADVTYGPHKRQVMDVWLAQSDKPTPVMVAIHGGGFRGGNKSVSGGLLQACLDAKISVVAITYRLSDEAIAPAQFHDAARAIQFIRHQSQTWNLDPKRIAATGGSAGAGLSLWLGFHEDMADSDNKDPVLRQSTRLSAMAVYNGQTSYDPRVIRDLFPGTNTYKHTALAQLYDVNLDQLDDLPKAKYALFEEVSAMPHLTEEDPPALLMYASEMDTEIRNQSVGIHHPKFGKVLKEKMDKLGIACEVKTGINRNNPEFTRLTMEFLKPRLLNP